MRTALNNNLAKGRRHPVAGLVLLARQSLILSVLIFVPILAACSFLPRDHFTAAEQAIAKIPGIPGARFWADGSAQELREFFRGSAFAAPAGSLDVLALSGGAYDGAYGAGVVNGWTAAGTRPNFALVTGVSAGALIAPLAFLGPGYDAEIEEAFTQNAAQFLGDLGSIFSLVGGADLRRASLAGLVDRFVDERLLRAIAAEHAKGRRLQILTTNIDAQRGVVWDMGAIAASGQPNARQLFADVLTASASTPGLFAPTFIEAEANGRSFKEMHVDGGATSEVLIVPDVLLAMGMNADPKRERARVWVVINNHITPQFEIVEAGLLPAMSRSFSTLIKDSSRQTLFATADFIGHERFNLTYIDNDFDSLLKARYGTTVTPGFNAPYMTALYRYGYSKARSGRLWTHEVPLGIRAGLRRAQDAARP
ncbi:MAG: patatin-like phospholipase family protein [Rhodomicrobium sp.]